LLLPLRHLSFAPGDQYLLRLELDDRLKGVSKVDINPLVKNLDPISKFHEYQGKGSELTEQ
jgi:hypothetical protein